MGIITINFKGVKVGTFSESYIFAEDKIVTGIFINSTGTKLWMVGSQFDNVYAYTFSTAWDVSTLTYDSKLLSVLSEDRIPTGVWFKPDGTEMYVIGSIGNEIHTYILSTAWDVSTGTYSSTKDISANTSNPARPYFNVTGTKMFIVNQQPNPDTINEYSLTSWDMSTLTYVGSWVSPTSNSIGGITFDSSGLSMYISDKLNDSIEKYTLSTAYDISTAINVSTVDISAEQSSPGAPFIKTDNSKMIISGQSPSGVFGYNL